MIDPNRKPCVVIADDEQPIRDVMRLKFEAAGFDVHTADCGESAWQLIKSLIPDVAVLDYHMPHLSGSEVASLMTTDKATAHIPVIGISSKWDSRGNDMKEIANVREFVHKPFSPRKLVTLGRQVIGLGITSLNPLRLDSRR